MWQQPTTTTTIRPEGGAWVLRVEGPDAVPQEFTCATEEMAKKLEAIFIRTERGRRTRPN